MKTLIVNSYRINSEEKIAPFIEMVDRFSDLQVVTDVDLYSQIGFIDYDALVLSGSGDLISHGAYSKSYLEFLRYNIIPCLAVCYGHQILAKACGVNVLSGLNRIERNETIRIIHNDRIFQDLPPEISVVESHIEYVDPRGLAAAGFTLLATSPSCEVEAIKHIEKCFYGVQFHPERSGVIGQQIFKNFYEIIGEKRCGSNSTSRL